MSDTKNLGCIDPHGHYPFPASRDVCPECQAIQARLREAVFTPRHGLRYRWWRDIPWANIVTGLVAVITVVFFVLILAIWFGAYQP